MSTSQRLDTASSALILQLEFTNICADIKTTIYNDGIYRTAICKTNSAFGSTEMKLLNRGT